MISYYDLLGLLKDGKQPKEVKLHLKYNSAVCIYNNDNGSYLLKNRFDEDNLSIYMYLRDCLLDNGSFDKCIEIIENEWYNSHLKGVCLC